MLNGARLLGAIELSIDQETMDYERISVPIEDNEEMECHEMMVDRLTKLNMFMRFVQGLDAETLNIVMDNVIDEYNDTHVITREALAGAIEDEVELLGELETGEHNDEAFRASKGLSAIANILYDFKMPQMDKAIDKACHMAKEYNNGQ